MTELGESIIKGLEEGIAAGGGDIYSDREWLYKLYCDLTNGVVERQDVAIINILLSYIALIDRVEEADNVAGEGL